MAAIKYEPKIEILKDPEILAQRTVEIFVEEVEKTLEIKESFFVALSGGSTPKRFFKLLGTLPQSKALPWDKIHLFWVDERYVSITSTQSNYKMAADTFLNKVAIPQENIHRIPTEFDDINVSARKYEEIIKDVFKLEAGQKPVFDLIMLGMGSDGHTASLFPNSYASLDMDNLTCAVYHMDDKLNRITITRSVLCEAKQLIVQVQGREKAAILKDVITSQPDEIRYPIHLLWLVLDKVAWLIDKEAAANL
ncbi:MAG: 6-phosphogluconolactonase [Sedimentisphaerales bacterium]|nr:6-phosphogluconolactonase [Sedimentisphaerales bacterium]